MPTLEDAIKLAADVHRGQTDKAGQPYILHPLRVMQRMQTEDERIVAVLHDALEDCPDTFRVTPESLRAAGYTDGIIEALVCLTKLDLDGQEEPYDRFILRCKTNPLARRVKLADLDDNMDPQRITGDSARDARRLLKYRQAWQELQESGA